MIIAALHIAISSDSNMFVPESFQYKASDISDQLLCSSVGLQSREWDKTLMNEYRYETLMYLRAGVTRTDSESNADQKMHEYWKNRVGQVKCNSISFGVRDGSILKFAISRAFDDFVYEFPRRGWDIDQRDESDGMNAIEFLEVEAKKNQGNAIEAKYLGYRGLLKRYRDGEMPSTFRKKYRE